MYFDLPICHVLLCWVTLFVRCSVELCDFCRRCTFASLGMHSLIFHHTYFPRACCRVGTQRTRLTYFDRPLGQVLLGWVALCFVILLRLTIFVRPCTAIIAFPFPFFPPHLLAEGVLSCVVLVLWLLLALLHPAFVFLTYWRPAEESAYSPSAPGG